VVEEGFRIMILTSVVRDLDEVIDLLVGRKQIVAIFQNESEWGPRALGNRSILFDPRHWDAKNIVNEVKKREDYRPFAGTVMAEHADEYFEMLQLPDSPWMSFAIQAKKKAYTDIPTLVHADGTCRIQTVTREQNKNYYELIEQFYKVTDVPIIFNTSFNLAGEPLVETIYDAIDTCNRTEINYLYVPEDQDINIPYSMILPKEFDQQDENDDRDE
jgi:carbamoyltransferase